MRAPAPADHAIEETRGGLPRRLLALRRGVLLVTLFGATALVLPGVTHEPFNVPKLSVLLAGTAVALALRVVEWALGRASGGLPLLAVPAVAVVAPLLVAWIFSPYRYWSVFGEYGRFEGLVPYVAVALFGLLLAEAFVGRADVIAWTLAVSGGLAGLYGVLQALALDPARLWIDNLYAKDITSTIGNPNFLGGFLAVGFPFAVGLWLRARRGGRLAAFLVAPMVVTSLLAGSQGGWAATLAGLAVTLGVLLRERWRRVPQAGVAAAIAIALAIATVVVVGRVAPDAPYIPLTFKLRGFWWEQAVQMASDSPLTGRGPNAFAVEGVRYRQPWEAIVSGFEHADDPHSVPLSFLANAGILGLAGFLAILLWVVRRARRLDGNSYLPALFLGSLTAYFVQSIGSIDEMPLRVAFWGALAGLAASLVGAQDRSPAPPRRRASLVTIAAAGTALALAAAGLYVGLGVVVADYHAREGNIAFGRGRAEEGERHFESALRWREEVEYRRLYSAGLVSAAMRRGREGDAYISKMKAVMEPFDDFRFIRAIVAEAQGLHAWSYFEPRADEEALALFGRARDLDPYNPELAAATARVLIHLDRDDDAEVLLRSFLDGLVPRHSADAASQSELWSLLAIAEAKQQDREAAEAALAHLPPDELSQCPALVAQELLEVGSRRQTDDYKIPRSIQLTCGFTGQRALLDELASQTR